MDIRTYRAKTMPQALDLVRQELGSGATVLHTRELNRGLFRRAVFGKQYEVAATGEGAAARAKPQALDATVSVPGTPYSVPSAAYAANKSGNASHRRRTDPQLLAQLRAELIDCEVDPYTAQDLLERLSGEADARGELHNLVQQEFRCGGPIKLHSGHPRFVALVGPTGVGKTTTVAKLAANFRLRDEKRVGLITVDTYRIAAVEQLRTYAEIIDLPMEVVGSPSEMRAAVDRMRDFDLVLMDTAGRSPRDEVRIRELRTVLAEAQPDEVHLVLSAASSRRHLATSVEQFSTAGVTSLLITKLDEAVELGNLLTLAHESRLPVSYITNGQDVPDDIAIADAATLAGLITRTAPSLAA